MLVRDRVHLCDRAMKSETLRTLMGLCCFYCIVHHQLDEVTGQRNSKKNPGSRGEASAASSVPVSCNKCPRDEAADEKPNAKSSALLTGVLIAGCNKTYFLGPKMDYMSASSKCCDSYMTLASLKSTQEINCINTKLRGYLPLSKVGNSGHPNHFCLNLTTLDKRRWSDKFGSPLWTSGLQVPQPEELAWCSGGKTERVAPNLVNLVEVGGRGRCLALHPQRSKLQRAECSAQLPVLCEATTAAPAVISRAMEMYVAAMPSSKCEKFTCMPGVCTEKEMKRNAGLRISAPTLQAPMQKICGKNYYFGYTSVDEQGASNFCCQDRMVLAAIETEEEFECMKTLYHRETKFGRRFWVNGIRSRQGGNTWGWCGGADDTCREVESKHLQVTGVPDSALCLALDFSTKENGTLKPTQCSSPLRFICEDPPSFSASPGPGGSKSPPSSGAQVGIKKSPKDSRKIAANPENVINRPRVVHVVQPEEEQEIVITTRKPEPPPTTKKTTQKIVTTTLPVVAEDEEDEATPAPSPSTPAAPMATTAPTESNDDDDEPPPPTSTKPPEPVKHDIKKGEAEAKHKKPTEEEDDDEED